MLEGEISYIIIIGEDIIVPYSIKTNSIYLEENKIYIRYLDYYKKLYYVEMDTKKNARREGLEEGIEQKSREMIKAMLKKKMIYEDIRDISGKSINEIKEIEKSLD